MRLASILVLILSLAIPLFSASPAEAADCQFTLGFKALHDLVPDVVGDCVVNEHHNPENGDGLQETTGVDGKGGLMAWRKADNWTAYTDGYQTWINGPQGLQQRLNTERFAWEPDAATVSTQPAAGPVASTPVAPARPATAGGVAPMSVSDCPASHPIKGNIGADENIYHLPGGMYYSRTDPEQCFATAQDAQVAGFRAVGR